MRVISFKVLERFGDLVISFKVLERFNVCPWAMCVEGPSCSCPICREVQEITYVIAAAMVFFKCFTSNTITILAKEGDSQDRGTTLKLCVLLIGPKTLVIPSKDNSMHIKSWSSDASWEVIDFGQPNTKKKESAQELVDFSRECFSFGRKKALALVVRSSKRALAVCRCHIGQIEALQNTKKQRLRDYTITIKSNLELRCRVEVHREAIRKRMRRKVAKGRCRAEEVHSGREEKMIVKMV
ncbi:hypothetical protein DVH24_013295 [Malus domestica]|uniref:Uncharacterized protein n=1 Tax=Malus domestica TaxID=3750 RepID=A0A498HHT2_MALDO|nr:hypothetical protein DVH24_013295 [Malus domestica]